VAISDSGDGYTVPNIFEITFSGTTGQLLASVEINLEPVSMHFDPNSANGSPFETDAATGKPKPVPGKHKYAGGPAGRSTLTIPFTHFVPGDTYSFLIGFDDDDTDMYGYDADELGSATFTATVSGTGGGTYPGTLSNQTGTSYNYKAGYGLVDAQAALNQLLGK
jgi:hypothetical protein